MSRDTQHPEIERDGEEPIDPDIALISDYLSRDLTPAERTAVEQRLATDFDFYMKVSPLIRVWRMRAGFRQELREELARRDAARSVAPEARKDDSAGAFQYPNATLRGRIRETAPAPRLDAPEERASPVLDEVTARHIRRGEFWYTLRNRSVTLMNVAAAASILLVGSTITWFKIGRTPNDSIITHQLVRASVEGMQGPTVVETGPDQVKEIQLRGGSIVLLRPNSRLTYENILAPARGNLMALDGEMAVDVTMKDLVVSVRTSAGLVNLTPGRYAVRCEPSCAAMLVTVGVGFASMRRDSTQARFRIEAGEKGRLPRDGAPEKVEPGTGWPELAPVKP